MSDPDPVPAELDGAAAVSPATEVAEVAAELLEAAVPAPASAQAAGPVPVLDEPGTVVDRFDDRLDAAFDALRGNPIADRAFYTLTELADFSLLWHLIGVSRGVLASDTDRGFAESARLAVVLGGESLVVNGVLKGVFKRQRPVAEFDRPLHLRVPLTSSFPSGHASAAFCSAAVLSQTARGGRLWYGLAALVAASRVYVKIHHPSDVLAGAAVGVGAGLVARRVWTIPR